MAKSAHSMYNRGYMTQKRHFVLALGDLAMLVISLSLMIAIRFGTTYSAPIVQDHIYAFIPLFILWLVFFYIFNLYDIRNVNPNPRVLGRLVLAVITTNIIGGFFFYLQPSLGITPKTNLLIVSSFAFLLLILWRRMFYFLFASMFSRRIMLIGNSTEALELKAHIEQQKPLGTIVSHKQSISDVTDEEWTRAIDVVITEAVDPHTLVELEKKIDARVIMLVDAYSELFAKIPLSLMTDERAAHIAIRAHSYQYAFITRVLEICISSVVLIIFSPIILIVGLIKKIEDGGTMFVPHHMRVGKNGGPFHLYKMRSMVMNAEKAGVQWAEKNDARITRFGKIIRTLHIDEIPQLWNVLRGDMALVGPRPERPEFVTELEQQIPYYFLRHTIKPGFTGWAQIKFRYARSVEDSKQKLEYDLYYLENRTPFLDLGIVFKTIQIIFTH